MSDLEQALECKNKSVNVLRIRIIGFKDINNIETLPLIEESRFFNLSQKKSMEPEYFNAYIKRLNKVNRIKATNALEGLTFAIRSDWIQTGDRQRQIIGVFTDAPSHRLEDVNTSYPNYPADMPTSLAELGDLWNNTSADGNQVSRTKLKQPAKRLIIFAPQEYPWPELYEAWEQVVYNPAHPGEGLDDVTYEDIIESIVGSV